MPAEFSPHNKVDVYSGHMTAGASPWSASSVLPTHGLRRPRGRRPAPCRGPAHHDRDHRRSAADRGGRRACRRGVGARRSRGNRRPDARRPDRRGAWGRCHRARGVHPVAPAHKLAIVTALAGGRRGRGAMIGDGMNDAPALPTGRWRGDGQAAARTWPSRPPRSCSSDAGSRRSSTAVEEGRGDLRQHPEIRLLSVQVQRGRNTRLLAPASSGCPRRWSAATAVVQPRDRHVSGAGAGDGAGHPEAVMRRPPRDPDEALFSRVSRARVLASADHGLTLGRTCGRSRAPSVGGRRWRS